MKSSFCIDLQRFMLIPTKFPLTRKLWWLERRKGKIVVVRIRLGQHNDGFLFIEEAFVVLRRKGKIVVVRIRLGQHNEGFLFIEKAFVVLRRKGKIVVVRIRQG